MKKLLLIILLVCTVLHVAAQKYVGGDISLLTKYETNGAKYYDLNGNSITDMLGFFKEQGLNSMRVRLFVDPSKSGDRAACQDLDYVKALGKRIKDNGMSFVLDFHYSDTWADPAKQWTPDAWKSLSDADLYTKIYDYTKESLQALVDGGATPDFIQIGNEISYGMLWGIKTASSSSLKKYYAGNTANRNRFTTLLKKAGEACREICPNAKIILHTERVAQPGYITAFYQDMDDAGVDYDIIGMSYYPFYHGDFAKLESALTAAEAFTKDIMIVETGYYYAWQTTDMGSTGVDLSATYPISPEGQQAFTKALIEKLNSHSKVIGLYWWWMEACENGLDWNTKRVSDNWYNASLFNDSNTSDVGYPAGKAMPAIQELKSFLNGSAGISNIQVAGKTDDAWYTLSGQKLTGKPTTKGIYIHQGKKVVN